MNIEELKIAVEKSNALFKSVKGKYNSLFGNLVFSSPDGQCNLTTDMGEIAKAFPTMISDSRQKEKVIGIVRASTSEKSKGNLSQIIDKLEVKENTFVEIRFDKVDLPLIFELQKDNLVSWEHTPQGQASIRIVISTLSELCKQAASVN